MSFPGSVRSINQMSPKRFHRLAIVLILVALVFTWLSPSLFFGFDIIGGSDELRLFNKGKGLVLGDVDLYHLWNQPNAIDIYPPGYSLIVAELLTMIPGIDPFGIEYVYKALFFGVALILYFWLGLFFSRKMALAAVVIRSCIFVIHVSRDSFYTYLLPYDFLIGGGNYTEIAILLTLIFVFRFLNHEGSDRTNIAIIFTVGLLHGLTHISGFTSFTVFLSVFLMFYATILSVRGMRFNAPSDAGILRRIFIFIMSVFRNRVMMPVYVTIILPLIIFLVYYLRLVIEATSEVYILDEIMPLNMPIELYIVLMSSLAIFGALGMVVGGREIRFVKALPSITLSNRTWRIMILLYVASFLAIVYLVNDNPNKYAYAIYAVISGFPSFIPSLDMGLVPILTVLAGTVMFILSLIGAVGLGYKGKPNETFLAILYLAAYWFFAATFIFDVLIPHRSMFFLVPLSLMVGMAMIELPKSLEKFRILVGLLAGKLSRRTFRFIKTHRHKITAIILVGFLAIGIVAQANFEPIVRDYSDAKNILQFGSISSPLATTALIERVLEVYTPGESILCTPDTLTALYTFVDINPSSSPYWNTLLTRNSNFSEVFYSLNYLTGCTPVKWLTEHHGTLVVLGLMDVKDGPKPYGFWQFDTSKFDKDPNLIKLYENEFGELIYKLNVTAE